MIGDNRDPRPNEWGNFAEAAGYTAFVAYPGSEYTIIPPQSQVFGDWGSVLAGALGSIYDIITGSGRSPTIPSASIPTLPDAPVWIGGIGTPTASYPGDLSEEPEFIPGSIYEQNRQPETDWEEVYRQYQILNENPTTQIDEYEESEVAIDWGGLANLGIDFLQGQYAGVPPQQNFVGANPAPGLPAPSSMPTATPRTVTIDTVTGKITACKRRRRRRLLTEGDFNDLMRISTLPGNQNVRIALAKSIGRR